MRVITSVWRELQALRAEPTGLAARDNDRRRTFRAALRQAEEFAEAADVVSYAVKPIQLFYALSQAGRALAAARAPHPWMLRGHGLECRAAGRDVLTATVDPGDGASRAFQTVAAVSGSAALAGKAQLGALWAANPDLIGVPIRPDLGRWPAALKSTLGPREVEMKDISTATGGKLSLLLDVADETGEQLARTLTDYPSLAGTAALNAAGDRYIDPTELVERVTAPSGEYAVRVGKDTPPFMPLEEFWTRQDELFSVVESDSQLFSTWPSYTGVALPAIAGGLSPIPLLLWWSLLLGLSSLARYEPDLWTNAIDLDASPLAVDLQTVLDIAADQAPARILESLKGCVEHDGG